MQPKNKSPRKTKKRGIQKIRNKAPKKKTPIMGNIGSMTMMGY